MLNSKARFRGPFLVPVAGLRYPPRGWLRTGIPFGDRLRTHASYAFPDLRAILDSSPATLFKGPVRGLLSWCRWPDSNRH